MAWCAVVAITLLLAVACDPSSSDITPGCLGSPGASCNTEGASCPGGPDVCAACGPAAYVRTSSTCVCSSGTWTCGPPSAGEVQCPDRSASGSYYVDPECTVLDVVDGGTDASTDGATDADVAADDGG